MHGTRRFSAAPVNFDRFIVLARAYSRSLSPDRELNQMLRPFQGRSATLTSTAARESTESRVVPPQPRHQQRRKGVLIDEELGLTESQDGRLYSRTAHLVTTTRSTTVARTLSFTHAATSTSRSVSGSAAATSSAVSTGSSPLTHDDCPVGEETQELERSSYSVEEVDPLLQAAMQLGSPLYDPVQRKFVCWQLHPLEKRPRTSYGDVEGISCDFCGHTDWIEEVSERVITSESMSTTVLSADGRKRDTKASSVEADVTARSRFFYHCSACQVDICQACLEEVRSDERLHVPCFECQRCGVYETRQNAPLHRCAEVTVISDDEELSTGVRTSRTSPSRNAVASPALPVALGTASPKYRGVPAKRPVRLGLSRRYQKGVKGAGDPGTEMTTHTEKVANASPHLKRNRTSPEATPSPKQRRQEQTDDTAEVSNVGDVMDKSYRRVRRLSAGSLPKLTPPKQQGDHADVDAPRALVEAKFPPFARYEVHLTPRTLEEVGEVGRIVREQHLVCSPPPSLAKTCVLYFSTRLAAETCIDRATVASLDAILK